MNARKSRKSLNPMSRRRKSRGALAEKLKGIAPLLSCDTETMPPKVRRVFGPYTHGAKFRLFVYDPNRMSKLFDTRDEAERVKAALLRGFADHSPTTIDQALEEYLSVKERDGAVGCTVGTLRYKLRQFLPVDETFARMTPPRAQKLYTDETERTGRFGRVVSAATHRGILRMVKAFFRWAVDRKYISANPFDGVWPIGKVRAGKSQLRLDEARKLTDLLFDHASAGDEGALAVLTQVMLGLRSAEVLKLRVRDVDNDAQDLWIEGTKTKNARRVVRIECEPLRALLVRHCMTRKPDDLIFGTGRSRPHFTDYLWHRVRKLCALAGVPVVCPHSLRGLHATLAMTRGSSSRFVADALGHGSDAITKRHYIDPTQAHNASVKRVSDALTGKARKTSQVPDLTGLAATLRQLEPEHLQALLGLVGDKR